MIRDNHKEVTWNEKDDRNEKGMMDILLMNVAPEQHTNKEKKAEHHPVPGGSKSESCRKDTMTSEIGKKEEKSEGAQ